MQKPSGNPVDFGLHGKTVLITGSTGGIGLAAAALFGRCGAVVWLNGRSKGSCDEAVKKLTAETGGTFRCAPGDLSSAAGAQAVFDAVGPNVDVLVNNVGVFPTVKFENISDDMWMDIFNVNVMSGVRCSRYYLKGMLQRNWGRIVFVSSEAGYTVPSVMVHYGVTKTAQVSLARGLAALTKGTGVTVNSVLPGPTWTPGVDVFLKDIATQQGMSPEALKQIMFSHSLKGDFANAEEVANCILYVASALSSATNGAAIRCEGGIINHI